MADSDFWGGGDAAALWAQNQEKFRFGLFSATLDALEVGPGTYLLDAGCGTGGAARVALAKGARVAGIDASPGMIAYAAKANPQGEFRLADLEHIPFGDETFDAVIAADSVQFAKDRTAALKDIGRVCKKSGRIAIATWDAEEKNDQRFLFRALNELTGGGAPNPLAIAAPGVVESMLESAGLTVDGGGSVPTPHRYPDFDTYWSSYKTGGFAKSAIAKVGEETVRSTVAQVCARLTAADGSVVFNNSFRYVLARP